MVASPVRRGDATSLRVEKMAQQAARFERIGDGCYNQESFGAQNVFSGPTEARARVPSANPAR
jgi:hypothetical protein